MTRLSIVTPLFNKAGYIAETIESVRRQTVPDWEMIVVDNCSTDGGLQIARDLAAPDARIRCIESSEGCGPGAARNRGIDLASGDWVLFLDADDLLAPGYLEEQMEAARCFPEATVVAGCWQEFTDAAPDRLELKQPSGYGQSREEVLQTAFAYAPWAVHAAIVRRSLLTPWRRWNESLDGLPSEDTPFWFALLLDASLAWSPARGALYRTGVAGGRNAPGASERWVEAVCRIVEENTAALAATGGSPSDAQCETVMRVFEDHYRRARADGCTSAAQRALEEAKRWLKRCRRGTPSIRLRKLFGIALAARLAYLRSSLNATNL